MSDQLNMSQITVDTETDELNKSVEEWQLDQEYKGDSSSSSEDIEEEIRSPPSKRTRTRRGSAQIYSISARERELQLELEREKQRAISLKLEAMLERERNRQKEIDEKYAFNREQLKIESELKFKQLEIKEAEFQEKSVERRNKLARDEENTKFNQQAKVFDMTLKKGQIDQLMKRQQEQEEKQKKVDQRKFEYGFGAFTSPLFPRSPGPLPWYTNSVPSSDISSRITEVDSQSDLSAVSRQQISLGSTSSFMGGNVFNVHSVEEARNNMNTSPLNSTSTVPKVRVLVRDEKSNHTITVTVPSSWETFKQICDNLFNRDVQRYVDEQGMAINEIESLRKNAGGLIVAE